MPSVSQFTFAMTAPCEKRVGESTVPRTHHGGTERRHDEGPDGETRVELRSGEGVYSRLGPSRGDLSRREGGRNAIAGASSRTDEAADGKTSAQT